MRTASGSVPVLRQQLTAQQIAGVFAELAPSEMRNNFPAPGTTRFEYGAPAGRVAVIFERNGGQVRATVRAGGQGAEEEGEAIQLASAAELLHEYMHGPGAAAAAHAAAPAPTPAVPGLYTPAAGGAPGAGIPGGSQPGVRRGVAKDIQFRELPGESAPPPKPSARPAPPPPAAVEPARGAKSAAAPAPRLTRAARWTSCWTSCSTGRPRTSTSRVTPAHPPARRRHDCSIEGYRPRLGPASRRCSAPSPRTGTRSSGTQNNDTDFAYEIPGLARFRVNVFEDRNGHRRRLPADPDEILTAEELGLRRPSSTSASSRRASSSSPARPARASRRRSAAMIDHINSNRDDHIITIEDPVEFVHPNKQCLVNQREVGVHTELVQARAARRAPRGSGHRAGRRDARPETIAIAIETAETGHLVFGTLHTTTAASHGRPHHRPVPGRPAGADPRDALRVAQGRHRADALQEDRRRPRRRRSRSCSCTAGRRNLIREGKTFQIPSIMQTGKAIGMLTMNDALIDLVKKKLVEPQEAYGKAIDKGELKQLLERGGFKLEAEAA